MNRGCVSVVFGAAALLHGCASGPPAQPDDSLSQAEYAISQARQAVDRPSQSLPLYQAEQKLGRAKALAPSAEDEEQQQVVRWLAQQATLDARYAQAREEAEQARERTETLRRSVQTLQEEMLGKENGQ